MTAWDGLVRPAKRPSVPKWIAVVVVVLVVAFGVAAAGFLLTVRQIEDSFTRVMVSRADRLGVPASWTKTVEIIRPERFMCLSTNPCPSMARRWEADTADTSKLELQRIAVSAGMFLQFDPRCMGGGTCSGTAVADGLQFQLFCSTDGANDRPLLVLNVRPAPK
jgi:hypothetical protein